MAQRPWTLPHHPFEGDLRGFICLIEAGTMRVAFGTSWGTLEVYEPLNEGSGQIFGIIVGVSFDLGEDDITLVALNT